ncbi:MAG: sigma-70 family RNA polymerase sigma factor [Ruminococcaceae bacterium]|nr:sigma-70 family RNA polymerase sigma factor [Oscillospiraceae bacterium]
MIKSDEEILELFYAKDQTAVTEFKEKYGSLCQSIALNILQNKEDAEECVNDVYITLWNNPPFTDNFKAYVCGTAKNISLTKLKYNMADKRNSSLKISLSDLEEMGVDIPDKNSAYKDDPKGRELGELINTFLRQQSPDDRNVFIRRYWFMDSVGDIAEKYSFSQSKVKSMLFHTRNRLKRYLKKEGIDI